MGIVNAVTRDQGFLNPTAQCLMLIAELRIVAADCGIKSVIVRDRTVMRSTEKDYLTLPVAIPACMKTKPRPCLRN